MTRQSGQLEKSPRIASGCLAGCRKAYDMVTVNLIGIGGTLSRAAATLQAPRVFTYTPMWVTFVISYDYFVVSLSLGTYIIVSR